jgi:hypothetical protein
MQSLTFDQLHTLPTIVNLMTAARALGIGRTKAYELAQGGQFPCRIIRVGKGYHVPTADLLTVLGVTVATKTGTVLAKERHTLTG